jgi:hypothetical protein
MMQDNFVGKKYEAGLDVTEIAKRMRADIKQAIADGEIPEGVKARVRTQRFAGGQSIDIRVTSVPFMVYSEEYFEEAYQAGGLDNIMRPRDEQFSPEMQQVFTVLRRIHASYQRDNSDIQSDYFDVNYYGQVEVDFNTMPFLHDAYDSYVNARKIAKSMALREGAEQQGAEVVELPVSRLSDDDRMGVPLNTNPFGGEVEADGSITFYASGC